MEKENIFLAEEKKNGEGRGRNKFCSRKMYFVEEKKDGEGKREKYMEKENVTIAGQTNDNEQGKIGQLSQWRVEI